MPWSRRLLVIRDWCDVCAEAVKAWLLHTLNSDPEDWIDLIHVSFGDPRLNWLVEDIGVKDIEELDVEGYLPSGYEDHAVWNYCRDWEWMYEFWKALNKKKKKEIR